MGTKTKKLKLYWVNVVTVKFLFSLSPLPTDTGIYRTTTKWLKMWEKAFMHRKWSPCKIGFSVKLKKNVFKKLSFMFWLTKDKGSFWETVQSICIRNCQNVFFLHLESIRFFFKFPRTCHFLKALTIFATSILSCQGINCIER